MKLGELLKKKLNETVNAPAIDRDTEEDSRLQDEINELMLGEE